MRDCFRCKVFLPRTASAHVFVRQRVCRPAAWTSCRPRIHLLCWTGLQRTKHVRHGLSLWGGGGGACCAKSCWTSRTLSSSQGTLSQAVLFCCNVCSSLSVFMRCKSLPQNTLNLEHVVSLLHGKSSFWNMFSAFSSLFAFFFSQNVQEHAFISCNLIPLWIHICWICENMAVIGSKHLAPKPFTQL